MADGQSRRFEPTHAAPEGGVASFEEPTPDRPAAPLDGGLPVQVLTRRGAWAHVMCSNGWSTWVDGRLLVALGVAPVVEELELALATYSRLVSEYGAGTIDEAAFRQRIFQAGLIVHDDHAWIFDFATGKWAHYDGFQLRVLSSSVEG